MIPLILAGVGAYLVGSGLTKKKTDSYKDGGEMAKGGYVDPYKLREDSINNLDEAADLLRQTMISEDSLAEYRSYRNKMQSFFKKTLNMTAQIKEDISSLRENKIGYAKGGYMAKGGQVVKAYGVEFKNTFGISKEDFESAIDSYYDTGSSDNNERVSARLNISRLRKKLGEEKSEDLFGYIKNKFQSKGIYSDGGKMAKGGLASVKKKYEENEDENAHSENVVLLAKHFGTKEELAEAKKILALHEKEGSLSSENGKKRQELHLKLIEKARKEMSKEGISFAKGGYMAKGGKK